MIFYESFYEAAKDLPDDQRLQIYDAIIRYGCAGILPEDLTGTPKALFAIVKPLIDANAQRRENGAKGGRPRKNPEFVPVKSNKFVNFKHSGRNWDDLADQIMAQQAAQ
jgi:hypothetical protein